MTRLTYKSNWLKLRQAADTLGIQRDAVVAWIKRRWIVGKKLPNGQWLVDLNSIEHRRGLNNDNKPDPEYLETMNGLFGKVDSNGNAAAPVIPKDAIQEHPDLI